MSSSSSSFFFFPQILHATNARAPMSIAPPTPTTTPMIVFFEDELSPELLDELPAPLMSGVEVEVILAVPVTGSTELLVMTDWMVWLSLMVVKVVTTATVRLDVNAVVRTEVTGWAEDVGVMVDVDTTTDVARLSDDAPADEVWNVLVDVTTTVETDGDEGETVVTEAALDESADVESEDVPPVLNATLWRFSMAIAMSTSVAATEEIVRNARRSVIASERMLAVSFVSLRRSMKIVGRGSIGKAAQVACKRAKEGGNERARKVEERRHGNN
jgi:hypothetical protein